jgi:magnesium chelatase family protein
MNPCPCGYLGDANGRCRCTPDQVLRYRGRISGPLMDRIDLQVFVPRVEREALTGPAGEIESSATVAARVLQARQRQQVRQGRPNAQLAPRETERHCPLEAPARQLLEAALSRLSLSARAYHRVMRIARSIADLAGAERIAAAHVAEAVRYRELDRAP